jgi:hypothetical protein
MNKRLKVNKLKRVMLHTLSLLYTNFSTGNDSLTTTPTQPLSHCMDPTQCERSCVEVM